MARMPTSMERLHSFDPAKAPQTKISRILLLRAIDIAGDIDLATGQGFALQLEKVLAARGIRLLDVVQECIDAGTAWWQQLTALVGAAAWGCGHRRGEAHPRSGTRRAPGRVAGLR